MHTRKMALLTFGICLPLLAGQPDRRFEVITTDHADLLPGGTIRIEDSTGELNIEGWDQPRVEITVARYTWGPAASKDREQTKLSAIQVVKKTNGELTISTSRKRSIRNHLDYQIMVPRNAHLIIRHRIGDVVIHDVGGDMDVTAKAGDILLQLAGQGQYKIDARCRVGGVYSDFDDPATGAGKPSSVHLRVGVGGIEVQRLDAANQPAGGQ